MHRATTSAEQAPDPRNQPLSRGVTVTDWRLYTADHRQLDGVAGAGHCRNFGAPRTGQKKAPRGSGA